MPIKPENRAKYPLNWRDISLRIRARANNCCEFCGAENGKPHPITGSKVVLTVAHHPDPDPSNCSDSNLHALCQKCHNQLDAPMRSRHAARTQSRKRREALEAAGQQELL